LKKNNSNLIYHIFIHKTDTEMFSNDIRKTEVFNDIKECVQQEFQYDLKDINLEFHLTSYILYYRIYDHSLFECFSKVTQRVIKQVPYITQLLDSLISVLF
jgi:hypothetical protein